MTRAEWILTAAVLCMTLTGAHNHRGEPETYHVSRGHLFLLNCPLPGNQSNVTWRKDGDHNLSLPAGVEVRDGLLWFLPVQMSHSGTYTCEKRCKAGLWNMTFAVSVSNEECPNTLENISVGHGVSEILPCKQKEIFGLNSTRNIRWMKDCRPVEGEHVPVDEYAVMRLISPTDGDAGKYTCLVDISVDGRKYTASRSIMLTISNETFPAEPVIVYPQQKVVEVEVGERKELECLAFIGFSEDNETSMFWTVDGNHTDYYEELKASWRFTFEGHKVQGLSTLSISKVHSHFLNVPIVCHVRSPLGQDSGSLWLKKADHSALYTSVALCLTASLAIVAVAASFLFFKVDLMLAYRTLLGHFAKQQDPDGKLYDAYVSFLHPDSMSSAETASFALQILPQELENKHGYSLYIRGRDDCPGEAMHDAIAVTVGQCRRLIIILSTVTKTNCKSEEVPLCQNQNQLWYEEKVGLYDALTQNSSRVILLEIDGPVDYSNLSESLRYIKRKQGALRWKKPSSETNRFTKIHSNRDFWKRLRYFMPTVPTRRRQTIVL